MSVIWNPSLTPQECAWRDKAAELTLRAFAPAAAEIDRDQRYPVEHLAPLRDSGISGLFSPAE